MFLKLFCIVLLFLNFTLVADDYLFVTLEYPPLEFTNAFGEPTGIAVDIVKIIMERLGHSVEIKILPWARALMMAKEGEVDGIFTIFKNDERAQFLDFSNEILIIQEIVLYTKKGNKLEFNGDLIELKGKTIGVVSTISYGEKFDVIKQYLNLNRTESLESNFNKLVLNRVDFVVSNSFVRDWTLKRMSLENEIIKLPIVIEYVYSYIAYSRNKNLFTLKEQFNTELIKMKESGEYNRIIYSY